MGTSSIISPEAVAVWWGMDPALRSPVGGQRGACALWRFQSDGAAIELAGDPDPETRIILVTASGRSTQDYFGDGKLHSRRQCRPGLLNIVPAGERPRAILNNENGDWSCFQVYLPHALLMEAVAETEMGVGPSAVELIDPQQRGRRYLADHAHAARELNDDGPLSRLRIETLHQDMAIQRLRRHSSLGRHPAFSRKPVRGSLAPWQLRRATDAIEAHLSEDIGLDMLAGVAGCSPTHFSRAFKRATGVTPGAWRRERLS